MVPLGTCGFCVRWFGSPSWSLRSRRGRGWRLRSRYSDLIHHYEQRLATTQPGQDGEQHAISHDRFVELSLEVLRVERDTAIALRDEGRISDPAPHRARTGPERSQVRWRG